MLLNIFIASGALFATYWAFRIKKIFPAIITAVMVLGTALVILASGELQMTGFYMYLGGAILAFFYGVFAPGKNVPARIIICLMAATIFTYWLWVLNHWHGNTLLSPIFILAVAFTGIVSKAKLRNELGFLTIITVDAISILVETWMKEG